jgi:hypothetical protein
MQLAKHWQQIMSILHKNILSTGSRLAHIEVEMFGK